LTLVEGQITSVVFWWGLLLPVGVCVSAVDADAGRNGRLKKKKKKNRIYHPTGDDNLNPGNNDDYAWLHSAHSPESSPPCSF